MKATKVTITGKHGIHTVEVERADWSIRFYSFETRRHATRRVWHPAHGSNVYVQYNGSFWQVCTERDGSYDPWLVLEYSEVEPAEEVTGEASDAAAEPEADERDLAAEARSGRARRADGTEVRVPSPRTLGCGCGRDLASVAKALFGFAFADVVPVEGGKCATYVPEFGPCLMSEGLFTTRGADGSPDWSVTHRLTVLWDHAFMFLPPSEACLLSGAVVLRATLDGERVI